jgi:hypothetical protein
VTDFLLKDLDVFYISYDEPNCEINWKRIKNLHSNAKRVHGIYGFSNAHKECATQSNTYRFVTIDGDNWINGNIFNYKLNDDNMPDVCFSFKSINIINGLEYGNGSVKVWSKETYLKSKPYEQQDLTDFCWTTKYFHVDFLSGTTTINCTPYQAWRAGYREGIKLSYIDGKPLNNIKNNWSKIWEGNLRMLKIWTVVGRDIENGIWAILGARQGLYELITDKCKHTDINDYQLMYLKWLSNEQLDPEITAMSYGQQLTKKFNFYTSEIDKNQSKWIKEIYITPIRYGIMS